MHIILYDTSSPFTAQFVSYQNNNIISKLSFTATTVLHNKDIVCEVINGGTAGSGCVVYINTVAIDISEIKWYIIFKTNLIKSLSLLVVL